MDAWRVKVNQASVRQDLSTGLNHVPSGFSWSSEQSVEIKRHVKMAARKTHFLEFDLDWLNYQDLKRSPFKLLAQDSSLKSRHRFVTQATPGDRCVMPFCLWRRRGEGGKLIEPSTIIILTACWPTPWQIRLSCQGLHPTDAVSCKNCSWLKPSKANLLTDWCRIISEEKWNHSVFVLHRQPLASNSRYNWISWWTHTNAPQLLVKVNSANMVSHTQ